MTDMAEQAPIQEKPEQPVLTVTSRLTQQDVFKAIRYYGFVYALKYTALLLVILTAINIGLNLYHGLPAFYFSHLIDSYYPWLILLIIGYVFVRCVWYYPKKQLAKTKELYGESGIWEIRYSFFDDRFMIEDISHQTVGKLTLRYADIRRIRTNRYQHMIITHGRNRISINRLGLSAEDEQAMMKILKERKA